MTPLELTTQLGIDHPIVQAPLGGVPTNALVATVSAAGGLGSLGAAYLAPGAIRDAIREIRGRTGQPFAVNLFAGGYDPAPRADAGRMLAILADVHARFGLPPPEVPALPPDPAPGYWHVPVTEERGSQREETREAAVHNSQNHTRDQRLCAHERLVDAYVRPARFGGPLWCVLHHSGRVGGRFCPLLRHPPEQDCGGLRM